ncbi:MAG: tetratricopeptide repeat protein, partial [Gammaproteobacteria bacterium]|nr:tetratricopeptide repeat protein [Gammaproteobacteria bacterium]
MKFTPFFILLLFLFSLTFNAHAIDLVEENYSKGKQLIKEQSYDEAIRLMESVFSQKQHDKVYLYNLAIAYYKNADYDNASRIFKLLIGKNMFIARSYINLGLFETKKNNLDQARKYFELAGAKDTQGNIAPLANKMINRIDTEKSGLVFFQNCYCYLFMESGYEDKTLGYDDNEIASDSSNKFLSTTLFAQTNVLPQKVKSLGFNALFLQSTNFDNSAYNFYYLSSTVDKSFNLADYRVALALTPTYMNLGGVDYQAAIEAGLRIKRVLGYQRALALQLRSAYIQGIGSEFSSIDGTQQKARFTYRFPIRKSRNKLYYEFETNDRSNKTLASSDYYDYSPQRHKIYFSNQLRLSHKFSLKSQL